jgi:hypothetical protein
MKSQNIISMKLVAIGFAAALFFASAARSQEISNTEWPDGQDVVTPGHTASTQVANAAPDVNAADAAATANAQPAGQQAAIAQQPQDDAGWTTFLAISLALATLYAIAEAKRANRNRYARVEQAVRGASLS